MGHSVQRGCEINKKLSSFIKESGRKPTAIADKAGIRRDTFSRILQSKRPVYADEVKPICEALGISVAFLFNELKES